MLGQPDGSEDNIPASKLDDLSLILMTHTGEKLWMYPLISNHAMAYASIYHTK